MPQDGGTARIETTFNNTGNLTAGGDILLNVAVNKESSILTRLKASLNPVPTASYDSYEAKQRSECFPNTRIQVLKDIETWFTVGDDQAPIYVLDGVAGIGKSTIAQTIAVRAANLGFLGATFFFSRDEDLRKVAKYFFPTIAYQLARFDEQFAAHISRLLNEDPDAPEKRLPQQFSLLLLKPLQVMVSTRAKPILIVIDALDECENDGAEELLSLLGQHAHQLRGLKILVTTRPEWHLRQILNEDSNHERFCLHDIEKSVVESDVELYLRSRLSSQEVRRVFPNRRTPWEPSAHEMKMLCGICGTLFIIATTSTKFILQSQCSPQKQLSLLLKGVSSNDFTGSKHTNALDETYLRIIFAAQSDQAEIDEEWFRDLKKVLGALITLANPLPCEALASLLEMDPDDLESVLSKLHSLVAPASHGSDMTFRIHHKSFPDFITSKERIKRALNGCKLSLKPDIDALLWVDVNGHHLQLSKACLLVMNRELRWNMADINETEWYKDKTSMPHVVPELISRELAYAALHWASHLLYSKEMNTDLELQGYLGAWTSANILYWIEVMIILDQVNGIYGILQDAITGIGFTTAARWLWKGQVEELLSDASRFVQQGSELMKISPLHIYRSCLPFVPTGTAFYHTYGAGVALQIAMEKSAQWEPLLVTCTGHSDWVRSVAFSHDGCQLASGSDDTTIQLWDAKTGAHIQAFRGHFSWVHAVAFSRDGLIIASGSSDGAIRLWDAKKGDEIHTLTGHSHPVRSVAFSSDGSRLASGSEDHTILLWDARAGIQTLTISGHTGYIFSVAFSTDDTRLASGSSDKTIRIWNTSSGACIFAMTKHSAEVNSVVFSYDGLQVASGSNDCSIRVWDARVGEHITTLSGHSKRVRSVIFSNDGSLLASGSADETIRLWDTKTGTHISTLLGHSNGVLSVSFSSDGLRLASGSSDGTVRLWDIGACIHRSIISTLSRHSDWVTSVALSADGSQLASGSFDKTIRCWDAKTGIYLFSLTGHTSQVRSVIFSTDGSRLASGADDGTIRLWDVKNRAQIFTIDTSSDVLSVVFSKDESQLASGSDDGTLRIWDAKTGVQMYFLTGHPEMINGVTFSNDNLRLASVSHDKTVRLWDAKTCARIHTLTGHLDGVKSAAFSIDDTQLVSVADDGLIRLWDVQTGRATSILDGEDITIQVSEFISATFLGAESPNTTSLLLLVKRKEPLVTGLIKATLCSGDEWKIAPLVWFPPDMEVMSFAFNHSTSQAALGGRNGRVMVLDLFSELHQLS